MPPASWLRLRLVEALVWLDPSFEVKLLKRNIFRAILRDLLIVRSTRATCDLTVTSPVLTIATISFNPGLVQGGTSPMGTVALNGPSPAGGTLITLVSDNISAATVPASITVAASATTATFPVSTHKHRNSQSLRPALEGRQAINGSLAEDLVAGQVFL